MSDEFLPYIPVVVTKIKRSYDIGPIAFGPRTHLAQVITNPQLRADGNSRDDALKRLKHVLRSHFNAEMGSGEFEIVNMDLNEILVEEVMKT